MDYSSSSESTGETTSAQIDLYGNSPLSLPGQVHVTEHAAQAVSCQTGSNDLEDLLAADHAARLSMSATEQARRRETAARAFRCLALRNIISCLKNDGSPADTPTD